MTDAEKLSLCKKILNGPFDAGCDTAEELASTIWAAIAVIEFGGEDDG